MIETLELIARFEGAGGKLEVEGQKVIATYPPDRRDQLIPILDRLREQSKEVVGLLWERVSGVVAPPSCPPLPVGVRLVRYAPKKPPVAVSICSVVTDVNKFIRHYLLELDARLHHPVQIRASGSVFEILAKLAEAGVELALEPPPRTTEAKP